MSQPKKIRFTEYQIKDSVVREMYEHEVFLSFIHDHHAMHFKEWLEEVGMEAFQKFLTQKHQTATLSGDSTVYL